MAPGWIWYCKTLPHGEYFVWNFTHTIPEIVGMGLPGEPTASEQRYFSRYLTPYTEWLVENDLPFRKAQVLVEFPYQSSPMLGFLFDNESDASLFLLRFR